MPRNHPVSLQIADYLAFVAEDLRTRQPSPRLLASELDGLTDKLSFYANVCHTLTDRPLPARDLPERTPPNPVPRAPSDDSRRQLRSDIEEIARAIRVAELSQTTVAAFNRLVDRLKPPATSAHAN